MPVPRYSIAEAAAVAGEQIISADSHMAEPLDLWETRLPQQFKDRALRFPNLKLYETNHHLRAGGWDPTERLKDLAFDGISAEVLYPTLAKQAWLTGDPAFEEACCRVYNDWMVEFCSAAPERLWGLAMLSYWNIDNAVAELERCKKAGLRGSYAPTGPAEEIPYSSDHYDKFWAASEEMDMPVNLHINSGFGYANRNSKRAGMLPDGVHKFDCLKAIGDMVGAGVLERHPNLKIVVAEAGVGWIPFFAQEYDAYTTQRRSKLPMRPSEYVWRQVYGAFISDEVGGYLLGKYGQDNFMWSNDYPHPACIWPGAHGVIARDLGHLTPEARAKVICLTAAELYNGGRLPPPADPPGEAQALDEAWFKEHEPVFV
jgi:predicted TIM-barrel fold metal-dependent hydrolase